MRNPTTPKNASFSQPTRVPVDVKYRVEHMLAAVQEAQKFLNALDPDVFGDLHEGMAATLNVAEEIALKMDDARPRTRTELKEAGV